MSQDNNSKIDMGTDPVFKKLLFYIRVLESMHLLVYVQCVSSLILKSEGPPKGGGGAGRSETQTFSHFYYIRVGIPLFG